MMAKSKHDKILLAHGGGGQLSDELIRGTILRILDDDKLCELGDSAKLDMRSSSICFTTDSYVVKPLFFNGGDIGKLAVCGTVNDLAVAGARPVALSLSFIIETGFEFAKLERILQSIRDAAKANDVRIVTGDTKTVESGKADGIFINTAGVGYQLEGVSLDVGSICSGDKILLSGTIGDHGMTIISQRQDIRFESELKSDCAGLGGLTCELLGNADGIRFMRDPTRGGLAVTLNDISKGSGLSVEIDENAIPVNPTVQAAADMLGFDILNIANEGKFAAVVSPESVEKCLAICKGHPLGKEAVIIGTVTESSGPAMVEMTTKIGGRRIVQVPYGRELPRIC